MGNLYLIGPGDLTYKPESIPAADWARMSGRERYHIARRWSATWRTEHKQHSAQLRNDLRRERREFRVRFPGVDLEGMPRPVRESVERRCRQCQSVDDWPGPLHSSSDNCWLWQAAHFFTAQAGICGWCGDLMPSDLVMTAIDHIIPRRLGGPDDRWNRQLLHHGCNSSKGSRLPARAQDLAEAHGFEIATAQTAARTA